MNYMSAYLGRNGMWLLTNLLSIENRNTKYWELLVVKGMEKGRNYFPYLNGVSFEFDDEDKKFARIKGNVVVAELPENFEVSEKNKEKYFFDEGDCYEIEGSFLSKNKTAYLKKQFHICKFCIDKPISYEAIVPSNFIIRLEKGRPWDVLGYLKVLGVL
ncbi:MAG TPA: hypothetical protein PLJ38_01650 [bacterium]|nr:hypothetical protein [bacterium]